MSIIILTLTAFFLSIILVIIDEVLNKKTKKEIKILNMLPGYNCGACGYAGCSAMSEAILEDKNNYAKCKLLKDENKKALEEYLKI